METRDSHWGRLHAVLSEDGRGGCRRVGNDQREIVLALFANSGVKG
jgi:hypothetical protein